MSISLSTLNLGLTSPLTITDRKIKAAIIGCGRISKNHFAALAGHANDMELVGVCDADPMRCAEVAALHGVVARGLMMVTRVLGKRRRGRRAGKR